MWKGLFLLLESAASGLLTKVAYLLHNCAGMMRRDNWSSAGINELFSIPW